MLRWAVVPALAFAVAFGGSLAYFRLDDDQAVAPAAAGTGGLVVTYTPTVDDADHGRLGSIALDGSDLRNVIEDGSIGSPSVAPGGGSAAFQRAAGEQGSPGLPFIYVIPLDGSKRERRLTHGSAAEIDPAWSPDGRRIAFARRVRGGFDLFSARLDGSDERQLTQTPHVDELSPAWSPDGTRIAFSRYESGLARGSGDLWTMAAAGGRERRLHGDEHDYAGPAWSPDGRRIALLKDSLVSVMSARGGIPSPLTRAGDFKDSRPSWSPDGTRLAFTRDPGKILTVDSSGSHLRRIRFASSANGVAWVPSR